MTDQAFAMYWKDRNSLPAFTAGSVLNLGMGSPSIDFQAIPPTLSSALATHSNGQAAADYQPQTGEAYLRDLIAQHENKRIGASLYSAENVLIVPGALSGVSQVLELIGGPVAIFTPDYFNLTSRGDCVQIARHGVRLEQDDVIRCGAVETKAIALTNPNNPFGTYERPEMLDALLADCKSRGRQLVVDETCDCFKSPGAVGFAWPVRDPNLIRVNGVSKSLNLAGHRFGWILADKLTVKQLARGIPARYGNVHLPASRAIGEYLAGPTKADLDTLDGNYARMLASRDFAAQTLAAMPSIQSMGNAESSYYLTVKLNNASSGIYAASRLLTEHSLDVMPGEVFGIDAPAIRLCIARPINYLHEALARFRSFTEEAL
ncbi:MAG TPA: pyridoxal phosphate-dependent aminotransferase [Pirellulaceae bacterium]